MRKFPVDIGPHSKFITGANVDPSTNLLPMEKSGEECTSVELENHISAKLSAGTEGIHVPLNGPHPMGRTPHMYEPRDDCHGANVTSGLLPTRARGRKTDRDVGAPGVGTGHSTME